MHIIKTSFAILLAFLLIACGGKNEPQLLDNDESERAAGQRGGPGGTEPLFLSLETPGNLTAEAMSTLSIRVVLRDSVIRSAAASETIKFALAQSPDMQTSLSAASAITNDNGVASVDLRLGMMAGDAMIKVSHPQAGELDVPVTITEATSGAIRVELRDPGNTPVELAPYKVAFYDSAQLNCDGYRPRTNTPDEVTSLHVPDTNEPVLQNGFPSEREFTVIGEALGNGGYTLASGCMDGIRVNPGEIKVADIQLDLVPISPSGNYTVEGTWDISEAVASANGASGALINIVEFMANPGESLYDEVMDHIDDVAGFNIDLLLDITGIKDRVIDYVNDSLFRIAGVETFVAVSADLDTMLNELAVTSALSIQKTDQNFNFQGHEEWTSIEVSWSWQCEQQPNNADCGTHVVDLTEDGAQAGAVSYDWVGRVDEYDNLVIESHQAQIDVGRLQIYLLEQVILPKLTNNRAHSIPEALSFWVDCGTLARRAIQGAEICDPTGFLCLGEDEAEVACEAAVDYVADRIMEPLENQSSIVEMELTGNATLLDTDSNGIADEIEDGVSRGSVAGSTEPVSAEWSAAASTP